MTEPHPGDICHIEPKGTELESFSAKPSRFVLVGWVDDSDAFVYPVTTTNYGEKQGDIHPILGSNSRFAVLRKGLFRVPIKKLQSTDTTDPGFSKLRSRVSKDLKEREVRTQTKDNLAGHNPFGSLANLKKPEPPKVPNAPKPAPKLSDEELFKRYVFGMTDEEFKRQAKKETDG